MPLFQPMWSTQVAAFVLVLEHGNFQQSWEPWHLPSRHFRYTLRLSPWMDCHLPHQWVINTWSWNTSLCSGFGTLVIEIQHIYLISTYLPFASATTHSSTQTKPIFFWPTLTHPRYCWTSHSCSREHPLYLPIHFPTTLYPKYDLQWDCTGNCENADSQTQLRIGLLE